MKIDLRLLLGAAMTTALVAAPIAGAAPAGPATAKCGKLKRGLGKKSGAQKKAALRRFNSCQKQNVANRLAYNQIKDSRFVGVRGDGEGVDAFYCANGNFESRLSGNYGTGVSDGKSWRVKDAKVRQGGKWINAFLAGPGGYEVALLRRGAQWQFGVASLGRILYPGDVEKTSAKSTCAAL